MVLFQSQQLNVATFGTLQRFFVMSPNCDFSAKLLHVCCTAADWQCHKVTLYCAVLWVLVKELCQHSTQENAAHTAPGHLFVMYLFQLMK